MTPIPKKIDFVLVKIIYTYTNRLNELNTLFEIKNTLEFVSYPHRSILGVSYPHQLNSRRSSSTVFENLSIIHQNHDQIGIHHLYTGAIVFHRYFDIFFYKIGL